MEILPQIVIIPHNNPFLYKNISSPVEFYNFGDHLFDDIKQNKYDICEIFKGYLNDGYFNKEKYKCTIPACYPYIRFVDFTDSCIKKLAHDIDAVYQHALHLNDYNPYSIFYSNEGKIDIPNNLKNLNKAISSLLKKNLECRCVDDTLTIRWLIMKHNCYSRMIINCTKNEIDKFNRNCALIEYYFLPHVFVPPRYPNDRVKIILKFDKTAIPTKPLKLKHHPLPFYKVPILKKKNGDEIYDVNDFWRKLEDLVVPPWKKLVFRHIAKIAYQEINERDNKVELTFKFDNELKLIGNAPEIRRQLFNYKSRELVDMIVNIPFIFTENTNWYQDNDNCNFPDICFTYSIANYERLEHVYLVDGKLSNICLPCEYYPFFYNNFDNKVKTQVVLPQFNLPICISLEKCSSYYLHHLRCMNEIMSSFSIELEKETLDEQKVKELLENINKIWRDVYYYYFKTRNSFFNSIKVDSRQYWVYFWLHVKHYRYNRLLLKYSYDIKKNIFIQLTQPFVVLEHLFLRDFEWAIMSPPHYPVKINMVIIDGGGGENGKKEEEEEETLTSPFDTNIVNGITDLKTRVYRARIKFASNLSTEKTYVMFVRSKSNNNKKKEKDEDDDELNDTIDILVNNDYITKIHKKRLIQESDVIKAMINHYPKAQISYKDSYEDENKDVRELLVSKLFKEYFGNEGTMMIEQQYISEMYRVTDYYQMLKLRSACVWYLDKELKFFD